MASELDDPRVKQVLADFDCLPVEHQRKLLAVFRRKLTELPQQAADRKVGRSHPRQD